MGDRLVIISGPSGVGKSPLHEALCRLNPEWSPALRKLVLYNSRDPRPKEEDGKDYHFRARDEIAALKRRRGFLVMDVRGDLQALDLAELAATLARGPALFEGNPFVAAALLKAPALRKFPRRSVFISPLSREEIVFLQAQRGRIALPDFVTELQRRKLLRRAARQQGLLGQPALAEVERRAGSAYHEMRLAHLFDYVIPNHDGEDSDHWTLPFPIGDARQTLLALNSLLHGQTPALAEKWPRNLLP
jgi:guanylate kinase